MQQQHQKKKKPKNKQNNYGFKVFWSQEQE